MDSFWVYIVMALAGVVVRAQERGKNQRAGYGEIARHRNYNHLRRGDGRAAAHQRSVGLGRLKMNCTGVGAAI